MRHGTPGAGYRGPMQPETLRGERVLLRAVREQDAAALRAMRSAPEVVRWWREPEPGWPLEADAGAVALTIEADGAPAGFAQFWEEADPDHRHAAIDLDVENERAIRCYEQVGFRAVEQVGFRAVGVMRAYARDATGGGWRDALLMDLLAGELRAPAEEAARG